MLHMEGLGGKVPELQPQEPVLQPHELEFVQPQEPVLQPPTPLLQLQLPLLSHTHPAPLFLLPLQPQELFLYKEEPQ